MNPGPLRILLLLALPLALTGCDTGRVGMHKVTFVQPAFVGAPAPVQPTAEDYLKQLIRDALKGKGFEEKPGKPYIWRKQGTTVQVYQTETGELILRVGAFGSRKDVRVSERTEQELLAILKERGELELVPISPPKPSVN